MRSTVIRILGMTIVVVGLVVVMSGIKRYLRGLTTELQRVEAPDSRQEARLAPCSDSQMAALCTVLGDAQWQGSDAAVPRETAGGSPATVGDLPDLPLPQTYPNDGRLPTDLSLKETQAAEQVYVQETEKWKTLKKVTANITLRMIPDVNKPDEVKEITGRLELQILRDPWRYDLQIRDPCGVWTFNASNLETTVTSADSVVQEAVERALGRDTAFMAYLPHLVLASPFEDAKEQREAFKALQPWRSREAPETPQSFTFKDYRGGYGEEPSLLVAFQEGHLTTWKKTMDEGRAEATFLKYHDVNGFAFPTEFTLRYPPVTERQMTLNDIEIVRD